MPKNPDKLQCKARSKQSGERCKRWCPKGWKVCKNHGAHSGLKKGQGKGNKNAVSTGEYEKIWLDTLESDEKEMFDEMEVDIMKMIEQSIKLIYIRERRMLHRIERLKEKEFNIVQLEQRVGIDKSETNVVKRELNVETIQRIEEALTRLQDKKMRLIELKQKIENGDTPVKEVSKLEMAMNLFGK